VVAEAGVVVVLDAQLTLRAFDISTGKLAWKRDLIREHAGRNIKWMNAASPLLDGGLLYLGGGGSGESLMAIQPKDGSVVWKAHDQLITHATPTAATIAGVRQLIFFCQSGLVSVNSKDGTLLWTYKFPFRISTAAAPVAVGDVVYCSAGYGVGGGAVRVANAGGGWTATEIYRVPGDKILANHWSTPVAMGGHMYGMFQFKDYGKGPVKCVEIATGKVIWEQAGFGPGNVILTGGKVVALTDAGELVVIDPNPTAYKELARAKVIGGKCWSTPAISNGKMYLRSTTEAVCLQVK
jgi:outer membrane protein assembly factor BamB